MVSVHGATEDRDSGAEDKDVRDSEESEMASVNGATEDKDPGVQDRERASDTAPHSATQTMLGRVQEAVRGGVI